MSKFSQITWHCSGSATRLLHMATPPGSQETLNSNFLQPNWSTLPEASLVWEMTPYSASLKLVPKLFLTLPTSWLGLCTTLKCPEAKPILPSDSLAGATSFSTSPPWWALRFQKLLLSLNSSDSDWTSTSHICLPTNIGSSLRGTFLKALYILNG